MAKMKYSEIPRDLSSDSIAAYRLAQVSTWLILICELEFEAIERFGLDGRDHLIEINGKGIQAKAEAVPNRAHLPVILRPSDSSIIRCRHAGRLQHFVLTASVRARNRPNLPTKSTVTVMLLFGLVQVTINTVKWISNTDVPIDVEPAPPNLLLTCCISKRSFYYRVNPMADALASQTAETGWNRPSNLSRCHPY